jgi:Zn-dependent peptidase ImmA (M78 family)
MNQDHPAPNPLVSLRALRPPRLLSVREERQLAERQATKLLRLMGADLPPYELDLLDSVPRLRVVYENGMPVSGSTHWTGSIWVILINADEPITRQRFTAFHEFHHVVCQPFRHLMLDEAAAERVADHFAACVLMPRRVVRRCWRLKIRHPEALADLYEVSEKTMRVRLRHLGLIRHKHHPRSDGYPSGERR